MFVVHHAESGEAVSVGSRVADRLADGLAVTELSADDGTALTEGRARWDPVTRSVIPVVVEHVEEVDVSVLVARLSAATSLAQVREAAREAVT